LIKTFLQQKHPSVTWICMRKNLALLLVLVFLTALCIVTIHPVIGSENSWATKASMPSVASGCDAVVLNYKIYVVGVTANYSYNPSVWNVSVFYEYNPMTDTWATLPPMPTPAEYTAVAACGNKIYVFSRGLTQVYDPLMNTWENKTSMPTARIQMKANVVNGKIYLIGGRTGGQYSTVALNEVYDPAHDSWTTKAAVPYSVVDYASAVVENKIYLIGGQDEFLHESMNTAFNQIYDVETDSWSQGAPIPVAPLVGAAGATTGKMAPKRIYVVGGARGIGMPTNSNYVYDPQLDVWSTAADMPTARMGSTVAVINDVLYAIGGTVSLFDSTAAVEQYTPIGYGTPDPPYVPPSPSPKPSQESTTPEPFPTTLVIASIITVAVIGVGLLVYFKKRKR
jgi:N-acetylneuraminic acid mutarotase